LLQVTQLHYLISALLRTQLLLQLLLRKLSAAKPSAPAAAAAAAGDRLVLHWPLRHCQLLMQGAAQLWWRQHTHQAQHLAMIQASPSARKLPSMP
jgi:hypothetical protein